MENNKFDAKKYLHKRITEREFRRINMRDGIYLIKPQCKKDVKQMLDHMVQFYPDVPDCDLEEDATFLYNEVITKLKFQK